MDRRPIAPSMMSRLHAAFNAHDLDVFVACFAADYRSEQPAHPARAFQGREKVRENWSSVFAGVPDFQADLLVASRAEDAEDAVELGEWRWRGTYLDGSAFAMDGVIVLGIEDDEIAWGRLYMEVVEEAGAGIDDMVRETYRPPEG